jgi:hypothetical protein
MLIAIVIWAALFLCAVMMAKLIAFLDAALAMPSFREKDVCLYALFAVGMSCRAGFVVVIWRWL